MKRIIHFIILGASFYLPLQANSTDLEYAPVCSEDGKTYTNTETAKRNGAKIKHSGNCKIEEKFAVVKDKLTHIEKLRLEYTLKKFLKNTKNLTYEEKIAYLNSKLITIKTELKRKEIVGKTLRLSGNKLKIFDNSKSKAIYLKNLLEEQIVLSRDSQVMQINIDYLKNISKNEIKKTNSYINDKGRNLKEVGYKNLDGFNNIQINYEYDGDNGKNSVKVTLSEGQIKSLYTIKQGTKDIAKMETVDADKKLKINFSEE